MKKGIAVLLVLVLALGLCGCGAKEKKLGQIVIGTSSAIESGEYGEYNFDMLASGVSRPAIVRQETDGQFYGQIADWSTEDSRTWTFTVLDGIRWSDGSAVSAKDIEAGLASEDKLKDYESYAVSEDGRSLTIVLPEPNVRFLSEMTYIRPLPSAPGAAANLSCGPFVPEEFNRDAGTITFVPNEYYPEVKNLKAERIIFQLFANEDTMYMALQSGDIDMVWNYSAGVPSGYQDVLAGSENLQLISAPAGNLPAVLVFNNAKGPFADKNLRLAVSYALDYDQFKTYFGSKYAQTPGRGVVSPAVLGYSAENSPELAKDLAAAENCMKAAGYESKNAEGFFVNAAGEEAKFALTINSSKAAHVSYGELVKTQLEAFGIRVDLDTCDSTAYNAKTSNKFSENNITAQAAIMAYTTAGVNMKDGLASIYVDGNHAVQGGAQVFDPVFSALLADAGSSATQEEYKTAAAKVQQYYTDNCPIIPLFWDSSILAASARFEGLHCDSGFGLNNIANWFSLTEK